MGKRARASVLQRSKRPRPRPAPAATPNLEVDAAPGLSTQESSSRDWSDLSDGPTSLIAELVLAGGDVANYIRFRAVCHAWRLSSPNPRSLTILEDSRLHPRRWIMLPEHSEENLTAAAAPHPTRRRFLNVSTGQCVHVDVPELQDHGVLRSSTDGLLLLVNKATGAVRLLNPLTRQAGELPPLACGLDSPINAGLVDDSRRVLLYDYDYDGRMLAFATPGDKRWVVVEHKPPDTNTNDTNDFLWHTMSFAGRFYGITSGTDTIMVVDIDTTIADAKLAVAATLATPTSEMSNDTMHLVEMAGELMLVHRRMMRCVRGVYNKYKTTCRLYRVNLAKGKATPASARGRAIFVGRRRALAVSPKVFPSLSANTVYVFDVADSGRQIRAYNLRDGGNEEAFDDCGKSGGLAAQHPWSIADCLAAYVSR